MSPGASRQCFLRPLCCCQRPGKSCHPGGKSLTSAGLRVCPRSSRPQSTERSMLRSPFVAGLCSHSPMVGLLVYQTTLDSPSPKHLFGSEGRSPRHSISLTAMDEGRPHKRLRPTPPSAADQVWILMLLMMVLCEVRAIAWRYRVWLAQFRQFLDLLTGPELDRAGSLTPPGTPPRPASFTPPYPPPPTP